MRAELRSRVRIAAIAGAVIPALTAIALSGAPGEPQEAQEAQVAGSSGVWYRINPEWYRNADPSNDPAGPGVFVPRADSWDRVTIEELEHARMAAMALGRPIDTTRRAIEQVEQYRRGGGDLMGVLLSLDAIADLGVDGVILTDLLVPQTPNETTNEASNSEPNDKPNSKPNGEPNSAGQADARLQVKPSLGPARGRSARSSRQPPEPYDDDKPWTTIPDIWDYTPADAFLLGVLVPAARERGLKIRIESDIDPQSDEARRWLDPDGDPDTIDGVDAIIAPPSRDKQQLGVSARTGANAPEGFPIDRPVARLVLGPEPIIIDMRETRTPGRSGPSRAVLHEIHTNAADDTTRAELRRWIALRRDPVIGALLRSESQPRFFDVPGAHGLLRVGETMSIVIVLDAGEGSFIEPGSLPGGLPDRRTRLEPGDARWWLVQTASIGAPTRPGSTPE